MADKPTILIDRNGAEYASSDLGEINSLVMAHGYTIKGKATLADVAPGGNPAANQGDEPNAGKS